MANGLILTDEEKDMLEGRQGPGMRKAMEMVVALGRIYGARRLVPVASAQVSGVSFKNLGEAGLAFLQEWGEQGARARVPATLNPAGMDLQRWEELGIPREFAGRQQEVIRAFERLGIQPVLTCAPYLIAPWPARGSHLAWAESSAVAFANSVAGARTNREGGPSALAAAVVGRTAAYGLHLEENRRATVQVRVQTPLRDEADFGALGIWVGRQVGQGVPVFVDLAEQEFCHEGYKGEEGQRQRGNEVTSARDQAVSRLARPDSLSRSPVASSLAPARWVDLLRTLGAAMAASGAVALFHVLGLTPEVADEPALGRARECLVVTSLDEAYALLNTPVEEIDLVSIGCPHASLEEIGLVAQAVAGRRLATRLWVTTARATRQEAAGQGWVQTIEEAGGHVLADTCTVVAPIQALGIRTLATNAAKTAFYAPAHSGVAVRFGNLAKCVEAALTGRWPGG